MPVEHKKAATVVKTVCQRDCPDTCFLDADSLGVKSGDDITLFNERGGVTVEAVVTEKVPKGALWSPRPLTGKNGVPLNSLASSEPQILGAGPRFNSLRVRIKIS